MQKRKTKNPLMRRIPRELRGDWRKYLVVSLFLILVIGFVGEKEPLVKQGANAFLHLLGSLAQQEYSGLPLRVLQPSPAAVARVSGKYRYKLLIKCRNSPRLRELVSRLLLQFASLR